MPPCSRVTSDSPSPTGRAIPTRRLLPTKLATKASEGAATRSCGVPSWWILPSTITPTRSASAAASSKSWVTSSAGSPSSARIPWSSARTPSAGVGVEGRQRLVEQQDRGIGGQGAGEPDPLALAARELGGPCLGQVRDPEALEQLAGPRLAAEGHVLAHAHVREERVFLEDVAHAARLGGQVDPSRAVEEDEVAERDPPRPGPHGAGDRAQDRRLPRARGADQGEGLPLLDLERYPELEVPKRNSDVDREPRHAITNFRERRTTALTTTSRAPMASAMSKSTSSC